MCDGPDNFAGHPVSVAEHRAHRARDAREWTPREALIAALRDLDSGRTKPDVMAILMMERDAGGPGINQFPSLYAGGDTLQNIGLLEQHKAYLTNSEGD